MERTPTLVTYRSAIELRDAGIEYAYRKLGMHVGLFVVLCVMAASVFYLVTGKGLPPLVLLLIGLAAMGVAAWCAEKAVFPQEPRLTLDELETLRNDMGIPADVFKQTHDSVIHGSIEEHQAMEGANTVLNRIARAAAPFKGNEHGPRKR